MFELTDDKKYILNKLKLLWKLCSWMHNNAAEIGSMYYYFFVQLKIMVYSNSIPFYVFFSEKILITII